MHAQRKDLCSFPPQKKGKREKKKFIRAPILIALLKQGRLVYFMILKFVIRAASFFYEDRHYDFFSHPSLRS